MREWLGFEQLCMAFIDDPDMIRDMVTFWDAFVSRVLERMFEQFVPDLIMVSEDMAYKFKPMINLQHSKISGKGNLRWRLKSISCVEKGKISGIS